MTEIKTFTDIDAPVDKVWKILTDFGNFPKWNPLIPKIDGRAGSGEKLTISLRTPVGAPIELQVTIVEFTKNKKLEWQGKSPFIEAILQGDHYFTLDRISETKTRFHHGEKFAGWLEVILSGVIIEYGTPLYSEMNLAFKKECEKNN